jgi:hypothetical protein
MIKIEKTENLVKVYHPLKTITFDILTFNKICDNIFLIWGDSIIKDKIIREKSNIEELNLSNWYCLDQRHQAKYNDRQQKSLDVEYLIKMGII